MKLKELPLKKKLPYKEGKSSYWHKCGMYIYTQKEWASHTCPYKATKTVLRERKKYD